METQKILLIGHPYKDTILKLYDNIKLDADNMVLSRIDRLGGIVNFIRGISKYDHINVSINCSVGTQDIGSLMEEVSNYKNVTFGNIHNSKNWKMPSAIMVVSADGTKTTFVNFEQKTLPQINITNIEEADFCHIMYLNQIPSIDGNSIIKIKQHIPVVSADLCSTSYNKETADRIFDVLNYINYLFASEDEIMYLASFLGNMLSFKESLELITKTFKTTLVIHGNNYSHVAFFEKWSNSVNICIVSNEIKIKNVNPVGAGDFFAAHFIAQLYNTEFTNPCSWTTADLLHKTHASVTYELRSN